MFEELDVILPDEAFDGPMQMALDEILLGHVSRPTLRFYRWSGPCVTFGYFQEEEGVRGRWPDLPRVRRWTGGGMVLHGDDLTFSLVLPTGEPMARLPAAEFYRRLHALIAEAVAPVFEQGPVLAGPDEVRAGEACFSAPSKDDLILGGEKIMGGAQRRRGGALLYQGSLQNEAVKRIDPLRLGRILGKRIDFGSGIPAGIGASSRKLAGEKYATEVWNRRR